MPQLTQTVLQTFKAIHLPKILRLGFFWGEYIRKYWFLSLLKKERNTVYIQGMDFKLRNLSNVYNHVYNIWQQTGQSNFLERVFFYLPQHAFGFGPASARSFSIQPGIFLYLFLF